MLSRALMMMRLETLKISFALDIKLFEESVSRDIGTEGSRNPVIAVDIQCLSPWRSSRRIALAPAATTHRSGVLPSPTLALF
jgi:hypothetical protein